MAADQTDSLVFKKTVHQFLDIKNSASLSSFDDIRSWTDTLLETVEDGGYEVVLIDNLQYLTQNASHARIFKTEFCTLFEIFALKNFLE